MREVSEQGLGVTEEYSHCSLEGGMREGASSVMHLSPS